MPFSQKQAARDSLTVQLGRSNEAVTAVRVNALRTVEGLRDLLHLVDRRALPDILILPKVDIPGDLRLAASIVAELNASTLIFGIVEAAESLCQLRRAAPTCAGLDGLIFGAADFAADIGVPLDEANLMYAKHEVGLLASALDVPAIDSPCFHIDDEQRLRSELQEAKALGFSGKIAIHPKQVPIINEQFMPSADAIAEAERVIAAVEHGNLETVTRLGDRMVGPPFARQAKSVIRRASAIGTRREGS